MFGEVRADGVLAGLGAINSTVVPATTHRVLDVGR
jgi:hypothetical protein